MYRTARLGIVLLLTTLPAPYVAAQSSGEVPPGFILQPAGAVNGAAVLDVVIKTESSFGPFTAFSVRPPNPGATAEWFYIRNDNSVKGLERGAMIGMLMGAAEGRRWSRMDGARVNIQYHSVGTRKEILAVSLVELMKD